MRTRGSRGAGSQLIPRDSRLQNARAVNGKPSMVGRLAYSLPSAFSSRRQVTGCGRIWATGLASAVYHGHPHGLPMSPVVRPSRRTYPTRTSSACTLDGDHGRRSLRYEGWSTAWLAELGGYNRHGYVARGTQRHGYGEHTYSSCEPCNYTLEASQSLLPTRIVISNRCDSAGFECDSILSRLKSTIYACIGIWRASLSDTAVVKPLYSSFTDQLHSAAGRPRQVLD